MKKILFIDRDGTIIKEPPDKQIDSLEKLEFYPGVIVNLYRIYTELDFELVMVTNQDGLGTSSFPEKNFWPAHNKMLRTLENEGIVFSEALIDRSLPEDNAPTRKPGTALLTQYLQGSYNLAQSYVIGDRETDIQLAHNLGTKAIYLNSRPHPKATLSTADWAEIYLFLKNSGRQAAVTRQTAETNVTLEINLDGKGQAQISTGIGFFDHMLEQFAKHSGCNLSIFVQGDLHVDDHHTVEDTALTLGQAVSQALGNKKGISRYGFLLPMDDAVAQVAIDFSGRSYLNWQADFKREAIGAMPTELFEHFFYSFCATAGCNLYVKAGGENEHHKIEAIFKSFARAFKQAVTLEENNNSIPSTKGVL